MALTLLSATINTCLSGRWKCLDEGRAGLTAERLTADKRVLTPVVTEFKLAEYPVCLGPNVYPRLCISIARRSDAEDFRVNF